MKKTMVAAVLCMISWVVFGQSGGLMVVILKGVMMQKLWGKKSKHKFECIGNFATQANIEALSWLVKK